MKTYFVLLGLLFSTLFSQADDRYLSYDEFIRLVRSGHVRSVALDNFSSIIGETVEAGRTNAFRSFGSTGMANDPLLLQLLDEHGVSLSIQDRTDSKSRMPIVTGVLFIVFPFILLLLLVRANRKLDRILHNQSSPSLAAKNVTDAPSRTTSASADRKQEKVARQLLAMLDDRKRRTAVIVLGVLIVLTFAGHCAANNWTSPLACIIRTFSAVLLGYLLLYLQSLWRYPRIKNYFDTEALRRDARPGDR